MTDDIVWSLGGGVTGSWNIAPPDLPFLSARPRLFASNLPNGGYTQAQLCWMSSNAIRFSGIQGNTAVTF
jgi:hypothetical protein